MTDFKRHLKRNAVVPQLLSRYFFISVLVTALSPLSVHSGTLKPGTDFPNLTSRHKLSGSDRQYLGLPAGILSIFKSKYFNLQKVEAEAIVIAFFNRYCPPCKKQAAVLNSAYAHFMGRADLRSKIKFIAVGTGNRLTDVQRFKSQREILFPVLPDADFSLYNELGVSSSLPLTFVLKKGPTGMQVHLARAGSSYGPKDLINDITAVLTGQQPAQTSPTGPQDDEGPKMLLSQKALRSMIEKSMLKSYSEEVGLRSLAVISREADGVLFRGEADLNGQNIIFYSKAVSRQPLCETGREAHFIITFDRRGVITDFIPIQLTKYGNVPWNKQNVLQLQNRILNHSLREPLTLSPVLDAVSTATMTSSLIYDSLRRLQGFVAEME